MELVQDFNLHFFNNTRNEIMIIIIISNDKQLKTPLQHTLVAKNSNLLDVLQFLVGNLYTYCEIEIKQ